MYPILLFSIISIAVILERAVFYLLSRACSLRTVEELAPYDKECGGWKEAVKHFAEKHRRAYFLPLVAAYFQALESVLGEGIRRSKPLYRDVQNPENCTALSRVIQQGRQTSCILLS
jgi:hypothetical protein